MRFIEKVLNLRALLSFILIGIFFGGIMVFQNMSKLEDPEVAVKDARIYTMYPGASPHDVELQVTNIIEKEIRSMGLIEDIDSRSMKGMSEIKVKLKTTVKSDELEQMWDLLRRKVAKAKLYLPKAASEPVVMDDFGDVYGMFFALSSDGYEYEDLSDYANYLKREFLLVEGVRRVSLYGDRMYCVNIKTSVNRLTRMGLNPMIFVKALNSQNKVSNTGSINIGQNKIDIDFNSKFTNVDDISNLIIVNKKGVQYRLKDVADVEKDYVKPYKNLLKFNKKPAIGIAISMEKGNNVIELGKRIKTEVRELEEQIPVGIELNSVYYQPDMVTTAIDEFMINLMESVIIVIIVLMFSMGLRGGLIISSGLIFTILATFIILGITGGTIQKISLAAVIVAMGMLVDNAIVVFDGILNDFKQGMKREKALTNSANMTAKPLLGATIIAILAFLPIYLSKDTTGEYTRDLFLVIAISLSVSWVLALVQTPYFTDLFWKAPKKKNNDVEDKPMFDSKFYRMFKKLLHNCLYHKKLTLTISIVILILSAYGFTHVKQAFFPDMKYRQFVFEYKLPEGRSIEAVEKDLGKLEEYLLKSDKVESVTTSIGGTPARYCLIRPIADPSSTYGELIVLTKEFEDMTSVARELEKYTFENFPESTSRARFYKAVFTDYPIEAQISGPDPVVLRKYVEKYKEVMRASDKTSTVTDNWKNRVPVWVPHYSEEKAMRLGITKESLSYSMAVSTDGLLIGGLHEGDNLLPVYAKFKEGVQSNIENFTNIPVWGQAPFSVPLKQVIDSVSVEWKDPVIYRNNNSRAIRALASVRPEYTVNEAFADVKDKIDAIKLPTGYHLKWYGVYKSSNTANKYLFEFMPMALILMLLMLVMLFNGFKEPSIIMLCVPFALIGISIGMLVTGSKFGFTAIVGSLGLMGMMIKNSVVLIDEINNQINSGHSKLDSIINSAISRFRPVLLASLTTILGMIPLLSDKLFGSMAVAIMFGLMAGTIITLVLLPVLYALFFKVDTKPLRIEGTSTPSETTEA